MKAAVVNGQFAPVITCKGQHVPVERLSVFLRQHLSNYRMHRTGEHASWGSASLVTFLCIAFISLALVFSEQASAQDTGNGAVPQPANPPASAESSNASQSAPSQGKGVPPQPESGWYNPALSAKLSGMGIKSWGSLCPNFGDSLLGNAGGIRSKLADHGIAGLLSITATGWQNLLSEPSQTNGMQAYIGQKFTHDETSGVLGSYDLGHIGLKGAQIGLDFGTGQATSDINVTARGFRVNDLSLHYPLLGGKIELTAGYVPNDVQFIDVYVGGNLQTGAFGPTASLPIQAGLSENADDAPGLNVKSNFHKNWYDKIGVQRSLYPQGKGAVSDWSEINRHGVRFSEPFAKALVIDELGFKRPASTDSLSRFFRVGGLYNWSDYTNFNTGKFSPNWMVYLLGDQQLTRTSPTMPFRGLYGGFSVMDSPANVNVFRQYDELRLYDIGPFSSRPFDMASLVVTHSSFSKDARQATTSGGSYPPPTDTTSISGTYAFKLAPGTYIIPVLGYTAHPSFITAPKQGNDLNIILTLTIFM
jgi:porin